MKLIAKNFVILLGSQFATWCIALISLVVIPRYLHDSQFGEINLASSFIGFFGLFAGLGCGSYITKEVARDPSRVGLYAFNAMVMTAAQATALALLAILTAHFLYSPLQRLLITIACFGMLVSSVSGVLYAALQGEQRMSRTAIWSVVDRYVSSGLSLYTVFTRRGLIPLMLAGTLAGTVTLVANAAQLWRQMRADARVDLRLWIALSRGGFPFLVWGLALTMYGSIDYILLSVMTNSATVGWYALAYRLINLPGFLAPLVVTVFFPALSAHGAAMSPRFRTLVRSALRLIVFVSAPLAIGLIIVAGDIMTLLHYPHEYAPAIPLVRILALHIPVVGIDMVLGAALIATDRQRQWVTVGCLAAVLNPLLNVIAIPITARIYGNGAIGASAITVLTELFMMGGALYLCPKGMLDWMTASFLVRCVVASAAMLPILILLDDTRVEVKVVLGGVIYMAASLALRTISLREIHQRGIQVVEMVRLRRASSLAQVNIRE